MMIIILFFSSLFSKIYYNDEDKPPGFYRALKHDNGDVTFTPASTAMAVGSRVLHNGQDITAFDLRETATPSKQMMTVLDQKGCSSCWAFTASDVAGAAMFFNSLESSEKIDTVMSPQWLINCATLQKSYDSTTQKKFDCDGSEFHALRDIMEIGMVGLDCIPYEAKLNDCVEKCTNTSTVFKKFIDKTLEVYYAHNVADLAFLRQLVVTSGPVAAHILHYSDLDKYTGGVYEHDPSLEDPGSHDVTIYGFGVENNKNYWLVKNSHGLKFGVDGWIKIRMGTNESGIEQRFIVLNNNFNSSRPRPGVKIPQSQPKPGPGWLCSEVDPLYPECHEMSPNYVVDGSSYVPPPLPEDSDFSTPKNNGTATHYYVSVNGTGDCLSLKTACNITAGIKTAATSMVLHVDAGTFIPGAFTVETDSYLSFVGSGIKKTQMGTTQSHSWSFTSSSEDSFRVYFSWLLRAENGSGSGLYFSQMTLINRANCSGTVTPRYMNMFWVNGTDCVLTCASVDFVCEEDNKGMILYLYAGKIYLSDCTVSRWVCNVTNTGIFNLRDSTMHPSTSNVLYFQNVSFSNVTTGGSIITEVGGGTSYGPIEVFISKSVFENIMTTNDASRSGVDSDDKKGFRNQSAVYTANYKHYNRTVYIYNTRFSNVDGAAGAFSAGALFFNLHNLYEKQAQMPNITNCVFESCVGRCGGAVFVMDGFQFFHKCRFSKNTHTVASVYGANDVSIKNNRSDSIYGFHNFAESCSLSTEPRILSEVRGDLSRFLPTCLGVFLAGEDDEKEGGGSDIGRKDLPKAKMEGWKITVLIAVGVVCGLILIAIVTGVLYRLKKGKKSVYNSIGKN